MRAGQVSSRHSGKFHETRAELAIKSVTGQRSFPESYDGNGLLPNHGQHVVKCRDPTTFRLWLATGTGGCRGPDVDPLDGDLRQSFIGFAFFVQGFLQ